MIIALPDNRIVNAGHITQASFCPEPLLVKMNLSDGSLMEVSGFAARGLWDVLSDKAAMVRIDPKGEAQKKTVNPGGIVMARGG